KWRGSSSPRAEARQLPGPERNGPPCAARSAFRSVDFSTSRFAWVRFRFSRHRVRTMARNNPSRGFDVEEAHAYIARRDRKFATWLKRIEPIEADPRWQQPFDPVDALARAILFQQLSGK